VRTMGYERSNIVFYNDVRVSDSLRIGEPEQGLRVMRASLEAEQNVAPSSRTSQLYEAGWRGPGRRPTQTRVGPCWTILPCVGA